MEKREYIDLYLKETAEIIEKLDREAIADAVSVLEQIKKDEVVVYESKR